ncbi:unnamed protein product, partial [Polarella glacialis]
MSTLNITGMSSMTAASNAQKIVDDHRAKIQALAESAEREENAKKRVAELKGEKYAQLLERIKAREAKEAKKDERLVAHEKERKEMSRSLMKKMTGAFDKVQQHQQLTTENWAKARDERNAHMGDVLDRKSESQQFAQEEMIRLYKEKEEKIMERMDRKRELERERIVQSEGNYEVKLKFLNEQMEERQAAKEAAFKKTSESLQRAGEEVTKKNQERSQAVREGLEKRFTKKDQAVAAQRTARSLKNKEAKEKMNKQVAGSPRVDSFHEEMVRKREQHELMD